MNIRLLAGLWLVMGPIAYSHAGEAVYPSTYAVRDTPDILIHNAMVLTGSGERLKDGYVHIIDGEIESVGDGEAPAVNDQTIIVDANGKWVTPGIIDVPRTMDTLNPDKAPGNFIPWTVLDETFFSTTLLPPNRFAEPGRICSVVTPPASAGKPGRSKNSSPKKTSRY